MFYKGMKHVYRQESDGEGDASSAAPAGDDAGEAQTEGQTQSAAPEIEEKARKMGWTPKDEFRGDPAKWRDAEEFVDRGENMLPILRKTVEKQQREMAELQKSILEMREYHSKTEQRAYAKAYGELKAQQMQAVAEGNTEAFQQLDQEIENLQKEVTQKPKDENKAQDVHPDYPEWEARNRWVKTDPVMLAYGEAQVEYIRRTKPGMSYAEQLEEVTKAVKKEFPEKFSNPRRTSAPSVEGATAVAKKGGKSYADMPKEARETCDRLVRIHKINKDEYVRTYFEGE